MPTTRHATAAAEPQRSDIAAVVLAAGHSRRMGAANKLLVPWQGRPLLRQVVENALASSVGQVCVITGYQAEAVATCLADLPVTIHYNSEHPSGMASSLRTAVRALPETVEGMLVCLGDMPLVQARHLDRLVAAFAPQAGRAICIPTYQGKRGNPVLLGRQLFPQLAALQGDQGGRGVVAACKELVVEVAMADAAVLLDVDTPATLAGLDGKFARLLP